MFPRPAALSVYLGGSEVVEVVVEVVVVVVVVGLVVLGLAVPFVVVDGAVTGDNGLAKFSVGVVVVGAGDAELSVSDKGPS